MAYSPLITAGAIINLSISLCIKLTAFLYAAVHTIWSIAKLVFTSLSAPVEYLFPREQPGANRVRLAFQGVLQAAGGALWTATHVCGAPFKAAYQLWAYLYSGEKSITPLEDDVTLSITLSGLETLDNCNDLIKNHQAYFDSALQHNTAKYVAANLRCLVKPIRSCDQKVTAAELFGLMETVSVTATETMLKDLLAPCGKQTEPILLEAVRHWAKDRKSETTAQILSCLMAGAKAGLREIKSLENIDSHAFLSNLPCSPVTGFHGSPTQDPTELDILSDSDMQKLFKENL